MQTTVHDSAPARTDSPRTPGARRQVALGLLAACALTMSGIGAAHAAGTAAPGAQSTGQQPGQWQPRTLRFDYLGAASGVPYSCQGLHDITLLVLQTLGNVTDVHADPGNCIPDFTSPSRFPYLNLRFRAFVPAPGAATGAGAAGHWREVTLAPHHPFPLGTGDCELVDELRAKLFAQLAVRNIRSQLHCVPFQALGWALTVQVFVPVARP